MIKKLKYYHGFGEKINKPKEMDKAFLLVGDQLSKKVQELFEENKISELKGSYSSKIPGDPPEIDFLRIKTENEEFEIRVLNRGLSLLMENNDELIRIHKFIEGTLKELSEKY